jgi:PAS domain S-box-containing protein
MGRTTNTSSDDASRRPALTRKIHILIAWMLLAAGVGWLDYITGADFSFSIFYMVPICLVAWQVGAGAGMVIAYYCAGLWLVADLSTEHYYEHNLAPYWNAITRLVFFKTCVFLLTALREAKENVEHQAVALKKEIQEHNRTHQIVLEHEQLLRSITEAAVDLLVVLDRRGAVTYASPSYWRIFNSNPATELDFFRTIAPDDRSRIVSAFQSVLETYAPQRIDYRAVTPDGRTYAFESQWSFSAGAAASGGKVVVVVRDVTGWRDAEVMERGQRETFEMLARGDALRDILAFLCTCLHKWSNGRMLPAFYVADDAGAQYTLVAAPVFDPCQGKLPSSADLCADGNVSTTVTALESLVRPNPLGSENDSPIEPRLVREMNLRGVVSIGIRSVKDLMLARLDIYFRDLDELSAADRAVLEKAGRIGAIVIERYTLLNNLTRLAQARLSAQEAERRRVARELHDVVNQMLSTVSFRVADLREQLPDERSECAQGLSKVEALLAKIAEEVARISDNLRPSELEELGFLPALRSLGEDFQNRTGTQVHLDLQWRGRFDSETELTLYRVVQEALNNVEKHAGADHVWIRMTREEQELSISVHDDGRGFGEANGASSSSGSRMGIIGMRERAELLGGTLDFETVPGAGTTITMRIPQSATNSEENRYGKNAKAQVTPR